MPFHSTSKKAKKAKKKPPSAYSKYETHPLGVALPAGKRFLQLLEQHSASLDTFAYDESGAYGRIPARAGPEPAAGTGTRWWASRCYEHLEMVPQQAQTVDRDQ